MEQVYIIDGIRTPIGKLGGGFSNLRADDFAALAIEELVKRNPSIPRGAYDEVILGCHNQAGEDNRNIARMALLLAGLPVTVTGETVNRLCSSGMAAIINGKRTIQCNDADLIIAGGVEHMTRAPWVLAKNEQAYSNSFQMENSAFGWRFINPKMTELYGTESMGMTAENLVDKYSITREDQDEFAFRSQMKAAKAQQNGRFSEEIFKITYTYKGKKYSIEEDEFIKPNTSIDALKKLNPAFKINGTVTAGNSSGLNDGVALCLLASQKAIENYQLQPMAKIVASATTGVLPNIMGIGPVSAVQKVLEKTHLTLNDIDIIEINEAFAAQVLACTRALGLADNDPRVNPNGGAIALGHPLAMSGARITFSAALELQKTKKKYAIATLCVGVGQGYAVVLERV